MFLAHRPLLKTYLASEFVLSLPNLITCFALLLLGGGHVLTGENIMVLCVLFWVQSVVPMAIAAGCLVERTARE
jgi:hypothetical protein